MTDRTTSGPITASPLAPGGDRPYVRVPEHDRRIRRGDDVAGNAWRHAPTGDIRWVAVGHDPNPAATTGADPNPMGGEATASETRHG